MRTVVMGAVMLTGGAIAGVTVLLPPAGTGSDAVVLLVGAISALIGAWLIAVRRPLPEWQLGLVLLTGTGLVTLATFEGGAGPTGTGDNEMFYIWICLFSFYFLDLRHALGQLAVVGIAYVALLHVEAAALDDAATRLVVTLSTLLITGLLVDRLRRWLDGSLSDLTDRARLDSLSGLLNRRALEERAAVELSRRRREQSCVGMLVVDIDGFKALNDSAGHHAGDEVLCKVARVLERETREVDVVARVGGDEFAILLPGANTEATEVIATRLCNAVRSELAQQGVDLGISIGVAVGPTAGDTPKTSGRRPTAPCTTPSAPAATRSPRPRQRHRHSPAERLWNHERMPARGRLTLFHIRGIRIGVDYSWFFVLFLIILWLSGYYRDLLGADQGSTDPYLLAVASAVAFFASILLHELGHAVVANRLGIPITEITLWLFGGVARMSKDTESAGQEFKIAAAGPAVTALIAVACGAIGIAIAGGDSFFKAMRVIELPTRRARSPWSLGW